MARPAYRVKRKIATVPVTAGGFATVDLPRSYDVESIVLRIAGGLQVTGAATSVRAEAPCQTIARVELIADGKNTIYSAPFWAACLGRYERDLVASGARATTPPSGTGTATYQVEAIGIVDLMTPDGVRPKDTNFRTRGLSLWQLRLTFGNPGDNFVGGTVVYSSMNVDVFSVELVEMPDDAGNFTLPLGLRKTTFQEIAFTASNPNMEVRLPAGNLIKSVLVRGEGYTTAGEPSTGVLNQLTLQSGLDVRFFLDAGQVRALANADYGQLTAGYYVADLTTHGRSPINLSELWDLTGQVEPKAICNVNGATNTKLQVVVTEYILSPLG